MMNYSSSRVFIVSYFFKLTLKTITAVRCIPHYILFFDIEPCFGIVDMKYQLGLIFEIIPKRLIKNER